MKRLVFLSLVVGGLAAQAQGITLRAIDDPNLDTYTFGPSQCSDTLTVRWSNTSPIALVSACSSNPMKVWATTGECGNTAGTGDLKFDDINAVTLSTIKQGNFTVALRELPAFKSTTDGGVTCGATGFTSTHRICGNVEYVPAGVTCGSNQNLNASPLKVVYDTLSPSPPVIDEPEPLDRGVKVGFSVDSDTSTVLLEVRGPGELDYREIANTAAENASIRGEGLENNSTYDVRLRARDAAGNVSDPSDAKPVTPIKTLGFWSVYKRAGGTDTGGCSTTLGLGPVLLGLWALRRRAAARHSRSNTP